MAWVWFLTAECGDHGSAREFEISFNRSPLRLPDQRIVEFSAGSQCRDGTWWCNIIPMVGDDYLCGHGAPSDEAEAEILDLVASELYERLRSPLPYRYAIIGTEVDSGHSFEDLRDLSRSHEISRWKGAVLGPELTAASGNAEWAEPFCSGKTWIPYPGSLNA